MHLSRYLAFAATLLLLTACSSPKVVTDYNPSTDFSSYQKYRWSETSGADKTVSPLVVDHVKNALANQLDIGLYKLAAKADQANFAVRYYVAEGAQTIDRGPRLGIGLGSFSGNVGIGTSVGVPLGKDKINRNVQIIIDLIDTTTQKLSWRGSRVVELNDDDPKDNMARLSSAVAEIWSQFPPQK